MPVAVPIALAVVGAALTAKQAIDQNRAINKSKDANRSATELQKKQLGDAAEVARAKREREAAYTRSRISLLSGETGLAPDAYSGLFQQNQTDLGLNLGLIDQSLTNDRARADAGLAVNFADLDARKSNPLFAAFQGGLQGASTGLSISNLANSFPAAGSGSTTVGGATYGPNFVGPIPRG